MTNPPYQPPSGSYPPPGGLQGGGYPGYPPQGGSPYPSAPPPPAGYGYGSGHGYPIPGSALPPGVELASTGRRIGAFFLAIPLSIVTLVIGYVIWGLIAWSKGTSPALQVLGMKAWVPAEGRKAGFGTMALRDIVGWIATSILSIITGLISLIMFLTDDQHRSLADRIGSTIIVYDPHKLLG